MTATTSDDVVALWENALSEARLQRRVPASTYRLQMHAKFTLQDALKIVPYLDQLGVSHLYMSSLLTAKPGSPHGYDVLDHSRLNPEIGTDADLRELVDALRARQMGLIVDVVPNHMWIGEANAWWRDVLEHGPASRYASYFDIAWRNHPRERLRDKVLLPILDEPYGKVIQAGRLRLWFEEGSLGVSIDQMRLPLDPRTYGIILEPALESFRDVAGGDVPAVLELQSIATAIRHLPPRNADDPSQLAEAHAECIVIKRRLRELTEQHPEVQSHLEQALANVAGSKDHPAGFSKLVELMDAQAYRPCFWRVALDEINYRRFFDVNDLGALAAERTEVFEAIHVKPFEWLRTGQVDGFRIDHVDGLLNPKEYLDRLQTYRVIDIAHTLWRQGAPDADESEWAAIESRLRELGDERKVAGVPPLFVVIEKILGPREQVSSTWACDGTTGYEFLNELNGIFVPPDQAAAFTEVYQSFTGQTESFEQLAYEKKLQILRSTMASELAVLAHRLDHLAQAEWWSRDFTLNGLRHALEEFIACFPVYRTYVFHEATASDQIVIRRAARRARQKSPLLGKAIFDFISDTLLLKESPNGVVTPDYHEQQRKFVGKFQQLTSPVMAKGVEDTALYIFNRLISLNDVGGEPATFGRSPEEFHAFLKNRAASGTVGQSALSTHDTKRSEDVRARINVLAEFPAEWERRIAHWRMLNESFRTTLEDGIQAPDGNEEYFLYQTLLGAWPRDMSATEIDPVFVDRIQSYMVKALREAKVHSSWIHPEAQYDQAVQDFIQSILDPDRSGEFLRDFHQFFTLVDRLGAFNSLSQTLIRCLAPGIPDTYQGSETWDFSLVDPDNRRPVDYARLRAGLEEAAALLKLPPEDRTPLIRQQLDGEGAKQLLVHVALNVRRRLQSLYVSSEYTPLEVTGNGAAHIFGFCLSDAEHAITVVVPRLIGALQQQHQFHDWQLASKVDAKIVLPPELRNRVWHSQLTGEMIDAKSPVDASQLFQFFPVALWTSEPASASMNSLK